MTEVLRDTQPDLIVLARYMRILSPVFTEQFGERTITQKLQSVRHQRQWWCR